MAIDWLASSQEDRRALYRRTKRAVDLRFGGDWNRFYDAVFGTAQFGIGYQDNFRAGRIGRVRAAAIANWLDAQDDAPSSRWDALIEATPIDERLTIMPLDNGSIEIVGLARRADKALPQLRLNQAFCFAIDSARLGVAVAFQSIGNDWYPLPLSPLGLSAPVTIGTQALPRDADGAPIRLAEDTHTGLHRFAIVVTEGDCPFMADSLMPGGRVPAATLDGLAAQIVSEAGRCLLLRADCLFTS